MEARRLAVAHQAPGECDWCDKRFAAIRSAVLNEVLDAIEDPQQRWDVGGGLGWETARDVVKRMIEERH